MDKLMTLEEWAKENYAQPPSTVTLQRWAREARIFPAPEKHGRSYFVRANARYVDPTKPIKAPPPAATPVRGGLVERIRRG